MPGVDQEVLAAGANTRSRTLSGILDELRKLRAANVALFRSFDEEIWNRCGTANEVSFSVRSIPWIVAGHERHHVNVLLERYLGYDGGGSSGEGSRRNATGGKR